MTYDFSGWATKNDLLCSDGRIIRKDAFRHCDGMKVPMVWNHIHNTPNELLGYAILQNKDNGVRAYCTFNDSESAINARKGVMHGDITSLSIYANHLKQNGNNVLHGDIKEVSLVLSGANPGAMIDDIITHSDGDEASAIIYTDEELELYHADNNDTSDDTNKKDNKMDDKKPDEKNVNNGDQTVEDVLNTLNETQKKVVYALLAQALNEKKSNTDDKNSKDDKKGEDDVKHNAFETDTENKGFVLSHADEATILTNAKQASCGSFREAFQSYIASSDTNESALQHGFETIGELFPEYKDIKPGEPELLTNDQAWISTVMSRVSKSPISRVRTRQADIRNVSDIRGRGYVKGAKKSDMGNIKLVKRTTDPQTIYVKDYLHRDDIIDITDFSVVAYLEKVMRIALNEEIATAILIGDGRDEGDADKISDTHIRPIWTDDDLYTIHTDVDIATAKKELQGTNTSANFSENYIYAEAIIAAALYSREKYKGSGDLTFFCTPHLLNVMLLARDLNGRRIYDSKSDLAAALNVTSIQTVEQFEGKTRTVGSNTKKLLGIFVNLSDYQVGSTKGGEISKFEDFDINFNQEIKLIETRLSGALTRVYSAIVLEEPVTTTSGSSTSEI